MVGEVHGAESVGNRSEHVRLRDGDLMMIGVEFGCDRSRVLRFRKLSLAENDGECAWSYATTAQNAYQRAGIDAAGQEYSDGNIAHQVAGERPLRASIEGRRRGLRPPLSDWVDCLSTRSQ